MRKLQPEILLPILAVLIIGWLTPSWADDSSKININTASADELVQLKGIGEKKAAKIIEFRDRNGPFALPEDLIKVPGVGPKTLEANQHRITVE
ncbi:MAG: helix-hairpin-helix domain-containing protein [Desulfobacterales bacterium]|jgi:competence protein ComEA